MRIPSRVIGGVLLATLLTQMTACGSIFFPDRRGQIEGKIDPVVAALDAPDVRDKLVQSGAIPAPTSSAEFAKLMSDELARWGRVVKEKNIKED